MNDGHRATTTTAASATFSWMPSNVARDHHYLPQFYLRQFGNDKGLVTRTFRSEGTLHEGSFTPAVIGYERDLYSINDAGPGFQVARTDVIETDVFKPIDNDAAVAMKALIDHGPESLTVDAREKWALFVNSLLQRRPRYVNEQDVRARHLVQEMTERFAAQWGPPAPGRKDVLASLDVGLVARYSFRAQLAKLIRDPQRVKQLSELSAVTFTVPADSPVKFVTGDNPVVVNFGNPGAIQCLALALSPRVLLFCRDTKDPLEGDHPIHETLLVQNPLVIQQSEFVFSQEPLSDGFPLNLRKCAQDALLEVSAWPRNQRRPRGGSDGAKGGPAGD